MGSFWGFAYALFGLACAWGLWRLAVRNGKRPGFKAWAAYLVWYAAVVAGFSFTLVNAQGLHSRAAAVGGLGTLAAAVLLGLITYRLACMGRKGA
ncbi:MAG: hypothetical protein LBD82_06360 [Deltaproteobacteria bacterium]|jgi:hypothetical protein|nr:hypothetical protein [Deltaproteobacteria bacterium]